MANVVLGYDSLAQYEKKSRLMGAIVGRYANRIKNATAEISSQTYQLSQNYGEHQIHGGFKGFDKVFWQAKTETTSNSAAIHFSYLSKDGEEGYPGNLSVTVSYTLNDKNEVAVEYHATTDKETVINLTQHAYFNLAARPGVDVLNHELQIDSDYILELAEKSVPSGKKIAVAGTPFDFRKAKTVGQELKASHPQLALGQGYDHYWVKSNYRANELSEIAVLSENVSGRKLTVLTTEPGLQVYTANYLSSEVIGKGGQPYKAQYGICLETGKYPNAPAEPAFPTYILKPGKEFFSKTLFRFSTISD